MRTLVVAAALGALIAEAAPARISVTSAARRVQPGEVVVLTVRATAPVEALKARAFNRDLTPFRVDASRWRVLVGIDLAVKPGKHEVTIATGSDDAPVKFPLVVTRRAFGVRKLTVDPAFVTPPREAAERIEREAAELERIWAASSESRLWDGRFVRPVPHAANSAFGTRSVFNGEPRSQHSGADFRSPAGAPIKAPNAGRVVLASSRYFSGDTVVIDHGLGLFSLFAHLSVVSVKKGDAVKAGDVVGEVGSSGRVTGPHLHWAVRINGARVDPLSLLAVLGAAKQ
jgi:murein DD-endopeptidase MepM/ murein hydrolase activator NlpD